MEFPRFELTKEEKAGLDRCVTADEMSRYLASLHGEAPEQQPRDSRGQFVAAGAPDAAAIAAKAAADAAAAEAKKPHVITKVENINGHAFTFTAGSADALDLQIRSARAVAEQLATTPEATHRTEVQESLRIADLEEKFRAGLITTDQFLAASGMIDKLIDDRLTKSGVDVTRLSNDQFTESWAEAGVEFQQSVEGRDWPGGDRNMQLMALEVSAMGGEHSNGDKVQILKDAYASLQRKNLLHDGDTTIQELEEQAIAENLSPAEIIELWKSKQNTPGGNSDEANASFVDAFKDGRRSSTILGR